MEYQPPVILEPPSTARSAVIWLHGLGADGNDFVPVASELNVQQALGLRFIFPHAPVQPVTLNGGYPMPAWYDVYSSALEQQIDAAGIARSVDYLNALIADQLRDGIALNCLVLAGFSQGGVVALDCALRMREKPAGVIALSTYLAQSVGDGTGLPVFQAHGVQDDVVPFTIAQTTAQQLQTLGAQVDSRHYPMAHHVHPQEMMDIADWLRMRLGE